MRAPISILLSSLLGASGFAQSGDLNIVVRDGEGAVHNLRRKAVSPVTVEVRDERNRPVPEAKVRFTMPEIGPGGRFVDGSRTLETFTDANGRAGFSSFVLNEHEGRFSVTVNAIAKGREAGTAITQSASRFLEPSARQDQPAIHRRSSKGLAVVLGIGAAATIAGVLASRGGAGPGTPPVSIGVGGVQVGGPR